MKKISTLFVFLILTSIGQSAEKLSNLKEESPEKIVASAIKADLDNQNDQAAYNMIKNHFIQMELMNDKGQWADPQLESISHELLPPSVTIQDFRNMVDLIAKNAEQNPYLHQFMLEAQKADLTEFYNKIEKDKKKVFPDVIAYAMALNALTKVMRKDVNILKATMQVWEKACESISILRKAGVMLWVKYYSVKAPLTQTIKAIESGRVAANFIRYSLSFNILEATLVDWFQGNFGNAKAGWTLAKTPPGGPKNAATGSGPATFSADRQCVQIHNPFSKEWANLYSVWNLGFVSQFESFPYWAVKLLIPQVSSYQKTPQEYMYNRTLALFTTLNYVLLRRAKNNDHSNSMDWHNAALTQCFSKSNEKSAQHYEVLFNAALSQRFSKSNEESISNEALLNKA